MHELVTELILCDLGLCILCMFVDNLKVYVLMCDPLKVLKSSVWPTAKMLLIPTSKTLSYLKLWPNDVTTLFCWTITVILLEIELAVDKLIPTFLRHYHCFCNTWTQL